jgi:hypothetical protein
LGGGPDADDYDFSGWLAYALDVHDLLEARAEVERLRSAMNSMCEHLEACHQDDEIGVELLAELRGCLLEAERAGGEEGTQ